MKRKLIFSLAFFSLFVLTPAVHRAATAVSAQEMRAGLTEKLRSNPDVVVNTGKKASKRLERIAKRLERKMAKSGMQVDFSDPVDQWLWFGVFGLGIAILMSFFNFGIGGLIAFLALVCLVIWVVKRGGSV